METNRPDEQLMREITDRTILKMEQKQVKMTERVLKLPLDYRMEKAARNGAKKCLLFTYKECGSKRYWSEDTINEYRIFHLVHTLDALAHRFDGVNFEPTTDGVVAWWGVSIFEQ